MYVNYYHNYQNYIFGIPNMYIVPLYSLPRKMTIKSGITIGVGPATDSLREGLCLTLTVPFSLVNSAKGS